MGWKCFHLLCKKDQQCSHWAYALQQDLLLDLARRLACRACVRATPTLTAHSEHVSPSCAQAFHFHKVDMKSRDRAGTVFHGTTGLRQRRGGGARGAGARAGGGARDGAPAVQRGLRGGGCAADGAGPRAAHAPGQGQRRAAAAGAADRGGGERYIVSMSGCRFQFVFFDSLFRSAAVRPARRGRKRRQELRDWRWARFRWRARTNGITRRWRRPLRRSTPCWR